MECPMRVLTPLLLLTLSAYVQAETLPSFLNSNDTVRTLPVPNLPADAYRPPSSKTQVPEAPPTAGQPLLMDTKVTIRKLQIEGGTVYPLAETAHRTRSIRSTFPKRNPHATNTHVANAHPSITPWAAIMPRASACKKYWQKQAWPPAACRKNSSMPAA